MIKELSLPYICEVHQRSRYRPKKYRHCCAVSTDLYTVLVEEEVVNVKDYVISGEVFFVEHFGSVELWFCTAWMADDFERRVHLFCLGYQPVTRKGEFI
jgi:hypothetical protein